MGDYKCGVCGDEFDDEEELEEHVKEAHSNQDYGDYECSICDEKFETKDELYAHMASAHPK